MELVGGDVSRVRLERWQALTPEQRRGFAPLCPDLVVELSSPSDDGPRGLTALRKKMGLYRANGAQLGWLVMPEQQAVEVWSAGDAAPQRRAPAQSLDAEDLFPGLQIDRAEVWAGCESFRTQPLRPLRSLRHRALVASLPGLSTQIPQRLKSLFCCIRLLSIAVVTLYGQPRIQVEQQREQRSQLLAFVDRAADLIRAEGDRRAELERLRDGAERRRAGAEQQRALQEALTALEP